MKSLLTCLNVVPPVEHDCDELVDGDGCWVLSAAGGGGGRNPIEGGAELLLTRQGLYGGSAFGVGVVIC